MEIMNYVLVIGQSTQQLKKGFNLIGSAITNDQFNRIVVNDKSVNPQHAIIDWDVNTSALKVLDLCSKCGTSLDGRIIAPVIWNNYDVGQTLKFGDIEAILRSVDQAIQNDSGLCQNNTTFDSEQEVVCASPVPPEMSLSPSESRRIRSAQRMNSTQKTMTSFNDDNDDFFIAATQDTNRLTNFIRPLCPPEAVKSAETDDDDDMVIPETQEFPREIDEILKSDDMCELADSDNEFIQFDADEDDECTIPESQCILQGLNKSVEVYLSAQSRPSPEIMKVMAITPKKPDDTISFNKDESSILTDDEEVECEEQTSEMSEIKWDDSVRNTSKATVKRVVKVNEVPAADDDDTDAEEELAERGEPKPDESLTDLKTQKPPVKEKNPRNIQPQLETMGDSEITVNTMDLEAVVFQKPGQRGNVVLSPLSCTQMVNELHDVQLVVQKLSDTQIQRETTTPMKPPPPSLSYTQDMYNQPTQMFELPDNMRDSQIESVIGVERGTIAKRRSDYDSPSKNNDIFNQATQLFAMPPNKSPDRMSVTVSENLVGNMTTNFVPPASSTHLPATLDADHNDDVDNFIAEQPVVPVTVSPSNKENSTNINNVLVEKTQDEVALFPKSTFTGPVRVYGHKRITRTPSPEPETSKSPVIPCSEDENEDNDYCMATTLPIEQQAKTDKLEAKKVKRGRPPIRKRPFHKPKQVDSSALPGPSASANVREATPNPKVQNLRFAFLSSADTPDHPDLDIIDKSKLIEAATAIKSNLAELKTNQYFFVESSDEEDREVAKKKNDGEVMKFMVNDRVEVDKSKPKAAAPTRKNTRRKNGAAEVTEQAAEPAVEKKRARVAKSKATDVSEKTEKVVVTRGKRSQPPEVEVKAPSPPQPQIVVEEKKSKFQYKTKVQKVEEVAEKAKTGRSSRKEVDDATKVLKKISMDYLPVGGRESRKRGQAEVPVVVPKKTTRTHFKSSSESKSPPGKAKAISKPRVLFTKIDSTPYKSLIDKLGGQIVEIPELATILVTDQVYRTYKFLCALAKGIPIVSDEWIKVTAKTMQFADPDRFIVADKEKERRFKFNIRKTLRMATDRKLLTDYSVFVTPHTRPTPEELGQIISCAGGTVLTKPSEAVRQVGKVLVVADPADSKSFGAYRNAHPNVKIISTEGLMLSVMQHEIKLKGYELK